MDAAIYCRLSEEDRNKSSKDEDSNSIRNQKAMLIQYAQSQGWNIHDIYSDDDYTGADRSRPQFRRLLADAEAHRFDIILCKTQSRFTRELELVEKYIHGLFPLWGIRFVSIVDNADTANRGNKKSRQINGLVNEWYLEDMSENIRSVLTSRRERGFHIGAFAPYGYQKDPRRKGVLIIDPEAAGIVREIFSLFASGYGKTAIAAMLNDRGIPNPTEYKRRKGLRYTQSDKLAATIWKYSTIAYVLTNEVYIGNLVQGKSGSISYKTKQVRPRPASQWIRSEQTHEPIIDAALWLRVQEKVRSRSKPFAASGINHPFSGKAVCMYCGYRMRFHRSGNHGYLQCTTAKNNCPGAFIPVAELERMVLEQLNRFNRDLLDRTSVEQAVKTASAKLNNREKYLQQQYISEERIKECAAALKQLYTDRMKGVISHEDYAELTAQFKSDKENLERQLHALTAKLQSVDAEDDTQLNRIQDYLHPVQLTRDMSELLIDHIEIGRRGKRTGTVPVSVFWRF